MTAYKIANCAAEAFRILQTLNQAGLAGSDTYAYVEDWYTALGCELDEMPREQLDGVADSMDPLNRALLLHAKEDPGEADKPSDLVALDLWTSDTVH